MSQWARSHPERMAEIARLPMSEQNDALRAEASVLGKWSLDHLPCRGCGAARVHRPDDFCSNCLSEAMDAR